MADVREIIADAIAPLERGVWNARIADRIVAALTAAGFAIVPIEPDGTMVAAGETQIVGAEHSPCSCMPDSIYRAMIAASGHIGKE
jgi:hypothetical protein